MLYRETLNLQIMTRILTLLLLLFYFKCAIASNEIYISKGQNQLLPIAINNFEGNSVYSQKLLENVLELIRADLKHSGFFKIISPSSFIENASGIDHKPHFASWRQINANLLLNGQIIRNGSSTFTLKIILWDIVAEKSIIAEVFSGSVESWRKLAHKISDKIYELVTGDKGYFDTKIFYISEINNGIKINKKLAVMDYDGANHQFLSDGKFLVLTPRLSPSAKVLLYVSYEKKSPKVYVKNLKTGRSVLLGNFSAMSFAPRFSPDGSKIVFSLAKNGTTDIWVMDLATSKIKQLTSGLAINTSPSYSHDSQKIYFNSDRSGSGQIYSISLSSQEIERMSFGEGVYSAPVCSPNGKYIAFTKNIRGQGFYIGVMRNDGSDERIITSGYLVEGASWAPNSKMIAFAKTSKPSKGVPPVTKLYTIDISGQNERLISTPNEASDPEWSFGH
jgi:TolB protein